MIFLGYEPGTKGYVGKIIFTFRPVTTACKSAMCWRHFNYIVTGPEIYTMQLQGTHLRL